MNIVLKKLPLLLEGRKLKLNEKCSSYMKKKKEMFFYDPLNTWGLDRWAE